MGHRLLRCAYAWGIVIIVFAWMKLSGGEMIALAALGDGLVGLGSGGWED